MLSSPAPADSPCWVTSEYGALDVVAMASPEHFRETEPINAVQEREFARGLPAPADLVREQQAFVAALQQHGVEVVWLGLDPVLPYQLNSRDVGAVVGSRFIGGRMGRPMRAGEVAFAEAAVQARGGEVSHLPTGSFEGGDLLVDGNTVYVGLGERTSPDACAAITELLAEDGVTVEPVPLAPRVLHLDTALTLVAPGVALAHRPALADDVPTSVAERYAVIDVTAEEFERVGCNAFAIRPGLVVVDRRNQRIADALRDHDLEVIEVAFDSTTKIGGSFRCMTLPLVRRDP